MKVIYNTCYADPWLKVAQKLKEDRGWEPIYWNGYHDDNSEKLVHETFPNCIYHPYFNAWKGIFPKEIAEHFADSYIDIDFLKDYASYELQAIKMMDRMDPNTYSFNFMERQRHYRNILKYWAACIKHLKPELVISATVPHQLFDYALYLLCKFYNIKYITFRETAFLGRIVPLNNVFSIDGLIKNEYEAIVKSSSTHKDLKDSLPADIIERFEKVHMDYSAAEPDYMKNQVGDHKKSSGIFPLMVKLFNDISKWNFGKSYFDKEGFLFNGIPTYHKQRNKSIEESRSSILRHAIRKLKTNRQKTKLKKHYNSLVQQPNFDDPYVLVALHYQPEMTTNPSGDIFVDQRLCIEMLAKYLPPHYSIYVKEHRSQFYAHFEGHTGRIKQFYDDLVAYPQVKLMPLNDDMFSLIKHSKAVATVTGTSGWEAMVLGKPVLIFGLSWYEKYTGVLKITDEKTAAQISQFITQFNLDERNLLAYLNAFREKSVKAYYYRGLKEKMNQLEEECVNNLSQSVLTMAKEEK